MKKIIPVIILLSIVLFSCKSMDIKQKPKAKAKGVDIESVSLDDITLLFDVELDNPYPIPFKLNDVMFTLIVENQEVFKTNTPKGLSLKPKGKKVTTFRVKLPYKALYKLAGNISQKEYLDTVIKLKIVLPSCIQKLSFDYTLKKRIPIIKPEIKIRNFKIKKPKLSLLKKDITFEVDFDKEIKNKTKTTFSVDTLSYDVKLNNGRFLTGRSSTLKNTGRTSILRLRNKASARKTGKGVLNALKKGKGAYTLEGSADLRLPKSIKKGPLKLKFNVKGDI